MSVSAFTRLMNNQIKKSQKKAIGKSVSQLGCVSQDSDALVSQGTRVSVRPDAESLESKFEKFDSRYKSSEYPGKRKDHRWESTQVVPRQRSPYAPKFEDRSQCEETGRHQRCAQSKAWDLANFFFFASSNRRTGLHSSHLQRSGFSQVLALNSVSHFIDTVRA